MELALFIVLAIFALAGLYLSAALQKRLRAKHTDAWMRLGRPSLVMNNSIKNNLSVMRFLWKKEYLPLHDPELTKLCDVLRIFNVVYVALFGFVLVVFLIIIINAQQRPDIV